MSVTVPRGEEVQLHCAITNKEKLKKKLKQNASQCLHQKVSDDMDEHPCSGLPPDVASAASVNRLTSRKYPSSKSLNLFIKCKHCRCNYMGSFERPLHKSFDKGKAGCLMLRAQANLLNYKLYLIGKMA